jgi:hypothetical protein
MHAPSQPDDPAQLDQVTDEADDASQAVSQRQVCLLEVWKAPGRTAAEIAVTAGLKRHVPSRRLPELRKARQVKTGPIRLCSVTGNPSMTWLPVAGASAHLDPETEVAQ